jgi:redox-sensitive bicupin YhaK (pirin superfamily)
LFSENFFSILQRFGSIPDKQETMRKSRGTIKVDLNMTNQWRKVDGVFRGAPHHWVGDGFRVSNYFPSNRALMAKVSPFFYLDYHTPQIYEPTKKRRGVGPHPHRGIETVTIAITGSIEHHDSKGHHDTINAGDVQWMTAGSGILHAEYHGADFANTGGPFHMLQLWVNLPRVHKMAPPGYQALSKPMIPTVKTEDGRGEVRVIAGNHGGAVGPAKTFSPIGLFEVSLRHNGQVILNLPPDHNVALLLVQGQARIGATTVAQSSDLVVLSRLDKGQQSGPVIIEGASDSVTLYVLSGQPLDEPVVAHGPFVMNTTEEIQQAYEDFANGAFGELESLAFIPQRMDRR